jgi:hypothetical protein
MKFFPISSLFSTTIIKGLQEGFSRKISSIRVSCVEWGKNEILLFYVRDLVKWRREEKKTFANSFRPTKEATFQSIKSICWKMWMKLEIQSIFNVIKDSVLCMKIERKLNFSLRFFISSLTYMMLNVLSVQCIRKPIDIIKN